MREAVQKFGSLTERQMAACESCIAKLQAARERAKERINSAREIDTSKVESAFSAAAKAQKAPRLHVAGFVVSLAKSIKRKCRIALRAIRRNLSRQDNGREVLPLAGVYHGTRGVIARRVRRPERRGNRARPHDGLLCMLRPGTDE